MAKPSDVLTERLAGRRLTRLYLLALAGVAALTCIGQLIIQRALIVQQDDAYVVNIAGRQRFMSQSIAKLSLRIEDEPTNAHLRKELLAYAERLARSHTALKFGDPDLGLEAERNPRILARLQGLDTLIERTYDLARQLAVTEEARLIPYRVDAIVSLEGVLLEEMDEIVFEMDGVARERVINLRHIEAVLAILILGLLLLEGLLIFRPAVHRVQETIHNLHASRVRSANLAQELEASNLATSNTLQNLREFLRALDRVAALARIDLQGRMVYVNEGFCELLGIALADVLGVGVHSLFQATAPEAFAQWIDVEQQGTWNGQFSHRTAEGELKLLDASIVPIHTPEGTVTEFLAIFTDLSPRLRQRLDEQRIRASALIQGQEDERQRLAREIHDGLGQMLTGLKFTIEAIRLAEDAPQNERLAEVKSLVRETIVESRRISFNLMPTVLSDYGLGSALKILSEQVELNLEGAILVHTNLEGQRLDPLVEITLYRIAQEALNNASKYAKADRIEVKAQLYPQELRLVISDDGLGFDPAAATLGHGLTNMQERAELIGGEFFLKSNPGKGTEVRVIVPLEGPTIFTNDIN